MWLSSGVLASGHVCNVPKMAFALIGFVGLTICSQSARTFTNEQVSQRNCGVSFTVKSKVASLLQSARKLHEGQHIHNDVIMLGLDCGTYLGNLLVSMYKKYDQLADARNTIHHPSVVSWTVIIETYIQEGNFVEALRLFLDMECHGVSPDSVAFICLLSVCNDSAYLELGKTIHCYIIDKYFNTDLTTSNALISMYDKCGSVDDAVSVFQGMVERDIISWNALIGAHAKHGNNKMAVQLFAQMRAKGLEPDCITFVNVLIACVCPADLDVGETFHSLIVNAGLLSDVTICNTLLYMYGRCGDLSKAWCIFQSMHQTDVVSWSCMMEVLSKYGHAKEAYYLLEEMQRKKLKPNIVTYLGALSACSDSGSLMYGKAVHADILNAGFELDVSIGNSLISMYNKCGLIREAFDVFKGMFHTSVVSWSALLATYADHGCIQEALEVFRVMKQGGVTPNVITFLALLVACCHAGLLEEGQLIFSSMVREYDFAPTLGHYGCMTDLLGKAGQLREVEDMITKMPLESDVQVWSTMLGGCTMHGDISRGVHAARHVLSLNAHDTGAYVLLSNTYASIESE